MLSTLPNRTTLKSDVATSATATPPAPQTTWRRIGSPVRRLASTSPSRPSATTNGYAVSFRHARAEGGQPDDDGGRTQDGRGDERDEQPHREHLTSCASRIRQRRAAQEHEQVAPEPGGLAGAREHEPAQHHRPEHASDAQRVSGTSSGPRGRRLRRRASRDPADAGEAASCRSTQSGPDRSTRRCAPHPTKTRASMHWRKAFVPSRTNGVSPPTNGRSIQVAARNSTDTTTAVRIHTRVTGVDRTRSMRERHPGPNAGESTELCIRPCDAPVAASRTIVRKRSRRPLGATHENRRYVKLAHAGHDPPPRRVS